MAPEVALANTNGERHGRHRGRVAVGVGHEQDGDEEKAAAGAHDRAEHPYAEAQQYEQRRL